MEKGVFPKTFYMLPVIGVAGHYQCLHLPLSLLWCLVVKWVSLKWRFCWIFWVNDGLQKQRAGLNISGGPFQSYVPISSIFKAVVVQIHFAGFQAYSMPFEFKTNPIQKKVLFLIRCFKFCSCLKACSVCARVLYTDFMGSWALGTVYLSLVPNLPVTMLEECVKKFLDADELACRSKGLRNLVAWSRGMLSCCCWEIKWAPIKAKVCGRGEKF